MPPALCLSPNSVSIAFEISNVLGQPPTFPFRLGYLCPFHLAPTIWELEEPVFKVTAHLSIHEERCWPHEACENCVAADIFTSLMQLFSLMLLHQTGKAQCASWPAKLSWLHVMMDVDYRSHMKWPDGSWRAPPPSHACISAKGLSA